MHESAHERVFERDRRDKIALRIRSDYPFDSVNRNGARQSTRGTKSGTIAGPMTQTPNSDILRHGLDIISAALVRSRVSTCRRRRFSPNRPLYRRCFRRGRSFPPDSASTWRAARDIKSQAIGDANQTFIGVKSVNSPRADSNRKSRGAR